MTATRPMRSIHCADCRTDVRYVHVSWRSGYQALAAHRRDEHPGSTERKPA